MKNIVLIGIFILLFLSCSDPIVSRLELIEQINQLQESSQRESEDFQTQIELLDKLMMAGIFSEAESLSNRLREAAIDIPFNTRMQAAQIHYLKGDFEASERLLLEAKGLSTNKWELLTADLHLSYVYYQMDDYQKAQNLFTGATELGSIHNEVLGDGLSLWQFMSSFHSEPYQIDWQGYSKTVIPFLPGEDWALPSIEFTLNGMEISGLIDTGGDMLILPVDLAEEVGIQVVTSGSGYYAGGHEVEYGYGMAESVTLGDITVYNIPVEVGQSNEIILGTGMLRHFLSTLDYPENSLVLYPKTTQGKEQFLQERAEYNTEVLPFYLYATHLILAHGSIDHWDDMLFLMDSGLEDPEGSSLTLPGETIELLNYDLPSTEPLIGESGAGTVEMEIGYLNMETVRLGPLGQKEPKVLYGAFPPQLYQEALGFTVDGILSHHFLRDYAWTLDFDQHRMYFSY